MNFVKRFLSVKVAMLHFISCAAICCVVASAWAQEMVPPLNVVSLTSLSFGSFSVERGVGSVVVDARSGACHSGGGAVMLQNICERGQFEIQGRPEAQILVELLPANNTAEAQLKNLTLYPQGILKLGLDGKARVQVGGELSASSALRITPVNASYQISVNYLQ